MSDPYAEFTSQTASDPYAEFAAPPTTPTTPTAAEKPAPVSYYQQAQNVARIAAGSLTLGQWDRVRAGVNALTSDKTYEEALKEQVGRTEQAGKEAGPLLRGTGQAIGGLAPGVGLASATSRALGTAARPLLQRIGIGAGEGATLGGLEGYGHTYSGKPEDYATNLAMGATFGAGTGAAAATAAPAATGAYRALANRGYFGELPSPMIRAAEADAAGLRQVAGTPGAMLPDAGPSMLGVAQGAVTGTGGPGRTALVEGLRARDIAAGGRITGELNQTFGPSPVPSQVEAGVRGRMQDLGPAYDRALANARAVDTSALAQDLEALAINSRGEAQTAVQQVRRMLDVTGNPGVLDPDPRVLQETRTAVRGMINNTKDDNTQRVLTNAYGRLTGELHAKVPGIRDIDSQYLELGTQERAIQAASPGARIFEGGRTAVTRPDELRDIMTTAAQPKGTTIGPSAEPLRLQQAARAELDRIVGTNKNDLLKLENVLGQPQDWNQQKLAIMFGQDRAEQLMNVLARERGFRQTYQDVVQGSQTAQRTAAKESLEGSGGKIPMETTAFGAVTRIGQNLLDRFRNASTETARDRIAQMLATRDPAELQQMVNRLLAAPTTRSEREAIVEMLARGGMTGAGVGVFSQPKR
jgi:hypothetical protein